jgi:hypothetical protein
MTQFDFNGRYFVDIARNQGKHEGLPLKRPLRMRIISVGNSYEAPGSMPFFLSSSMALDVFCRGPMPMPLRM